MKRATHILLGAAVALPIAASLSPMGAIGSVWFGMVGGGYPDWFDLRSDLSSRLKHRGASHSIVVGALFATGLYLVLKMIDTQFAGVALPQDMVQSWSMAFAAGFLSHILADACTRGGVQPFLPFSKTRVWILPKPLRGRSEGVVDTIARCLAIVILVATAARYFPL